MACKFDTLVKEKLAGPHQDFADWIRDFKTALKVTKTAPTEAVDLLLAMCAGTIQDVVETFVMKYKEDHAPPEGRSNGDARVKEYYTELFNALEEHLGQASVVVGSSPEARLINKWS